MVGPRFGTLAVARCTGGLKDTVTPMEQGYTVGNGFLFGPHQADALAAAMTEAIRFYREPVDLRRATLQRVMREGLERFSLANTAQAYTQVYDRLISGR
jgi:starch synthase